MNNTIFCVDDEPYCLWDPDLKKRNHDFLKSLDPDYFKYSMDLHMNADDEQRASVGIRLALHHALETLFSLLGAHIQAPDCGYAWLAKCSTPKLRSLTQRISNGEEGIFTRLLIDSVTWETVAQSVFNRYFPETEKQANMIREFSELWLRLAHELCNDEHIDEYNAMKHGFRVGRGGFAISIGEAPPDGNFPPDEEMHLLGESKYGSSFFTIEPLTDSRKERSLRVAHVHTNWSIDRLVLLSQLVHISINNVVSSLRLMNGFPANDCVFLTPEGDGDFDKPWTFTPSVLNMKFHSGVDKSTAMSLTKENLLAKIASKNKG